MNCKVRMGSIYYEDRGEGTPLLILHSLGTDHRAMKAWIEPIFKNINGYRRIYIDIPAHGNSLVDEKLSSTDDILLNILDFIDKVFPNENFSLIGFSYGGYLAQGILHFRQKQVKSICMLATALHLNERTLPNKVILEKDEDIFSTLESDIKSAFETLFVYQTKENLDCFLKEIQPGRLLANREFLTSNWKEKGYFFTEEPFLDVSEFQQPALVILGKQDNICGYEDYDFLLNKFPNSTFVILDKAGHMLTIEKRNIVQQLIKDWLV
ncbi:alpha/beta fold hydrolase [Pseudalkalibacillus berkeleyi]|uniref:Alpha/beta hydrolase n=1 Tax=Pseudalkalibacillus berkeleyi TaxID=1069813 RepID=A0ABS9GYB5_9BACL|nr:alpha/beta hydrolase [Pseudalkalibacillus berkeleyi]MCF6137757.1 alpha/beta hydrolase [Pseudalkalibacillus berkeleyi]